MYVHMRSGPSARSSRSFAAPRHMHMHIFMHIHMHVHMHMQSGPSARSGRSFAEPPRSADRTCGPNCCWRRAPVHMQRIRTCTCTSRAHAHEQVHAHGGRAQLGAVHVHIQHCSRRMRTYRCGTRSCTDEPAHAHAHEAVTLLHTPASTASFRFISRSGSFWSTAA